MTKQRKPRARRAYLGTDDWGVEVLRFSDTRKVDGCRMFTVIEDGASIPLPRHLARLVKAALKQEDEWGTNSAYELKQAADAYRKAEQRRKGEAK